MCLSGGEAWVFRIGMIWCSVQEGQLSCYDSGVGPSVECRGNSASKRQLDIQPAMVPFWFGGVCGGGLIDGWNNGRWCGGHRVNMWCIKVWLYSAPLELVA